MIREAPTTIRTQLASRTRHKRKPTVTTSLGGSCATLADTTVSCWGANGISEPGIFAGQLGHDPTTDAVCLSGFICDPVPTLVAGLSNVREVSAGDNATCAVKTDNTVVCWGNNAYGELGIAPPVTDGGEPYVFTPQVVPGLANVAHVVVGYYHACAVTWDNHVICWGDNEYVICLASVAQIDLQIWPLRS